MGLSLRRAPKIRLACRFFLVLRVFHRRPLNRNRAGKRGPSDCELMNAPPDAGSSFWLFSHQEWPGGKPVMMTIPVNLFIFMKK